MATVIKWEGVEVLVLILVFLVIPLVAGQCALPSGHGTNSRTEGWETGGKMGRVFMKRPSYHLQGDVLTVLEGAAERLQAICLIVTPK